MADKSLSGVSSACAMQFRGYAGRAEYSQCENNTVCLLTLRARQVWPRIFAFLHLASVTAIWCGVAPFRPPGVGMMPLRGIFSTCMPSGRFRRRSLANAQCAE